LKKIESYFLKCVFHTSWNFGFNYGQSILSNHFNLPWYLSNTLQQEILSIVLTKLGFKLALINIIILFL
jgi:hypothetical protein